jgi:hypothetical protein
MSTYSASRRVNGPGHPLDGSLRVYCRGLVPQVLWATSYGPINMDTTLFPPAANGWETKHPVLDIVLVLLTEGEGPPI